MVLGSTRTQQGDECWLVVMMADCDHNRFGFHVMWYEHLVAASAGSMCTRGSFGT
eukprot:COSAG03_NODE_947_length_5233_cov_13.433385_8_plen_55_part_00